MTFLQQNPFIRLLLALITGILLANFISLPQSFSYILFLLSGIFWLLFFCFRNSDLYYRIRWISGVSILSTLLAMGCWLTQQQAAKSQVSFLDQSIVFRAVVADTPEEKTNSILVPAHITHIKDSLNTSATEANVVLYFPKEDRSIELVRGNVLLITAKFETLEDNGNPEGFNYAEYLHRQGIAATAYVPAHKWMKIAHCATFSITHLAQQCQQYLLSIYKKYGIAPREYGVLAALTLGYKDSLDPDLQAAYAGSGAMHILAVSGLHVGIIFFILGLIFAPFNKVKGGNVLKIIFILLFLWAYAFVTGLSPSVLRATIMFSFVSIGSSLNRKTSIYNSMAVSAFFLLLFNPYLLFNVGFQLSYSAVISIVYFQPKISKLFQFKSLFGRKIWDLTSVSIAAQIGTAPWALLYFNQFSNYFLLTNIVAIPLAGIIIYTAVALFVFSPLEPIARFTAWVLEQTLVILNGSVWFINSIPHAVSYLSITSTQMFLLFGGIVLLSVFFVRKRFWWLCGGLLCLLAYFAVNLYQKYDTYSHEKLVIYSDNKSVVIQQTKSAANFILTDNVEDAELLTRGFSLKNRLDTPAITTLASSNDSSSLSSNIFIFGQEKFLILAGNKLQYKLAKRQLVVDCLILGNIGYTDLETLFALISPSKVIMLNSFPYWKLSELQEHCKRQHIQFCNMRQQGALIFKNSI